MKKINLRELYPDAYTTDFFVNVTEDVLETIRASERAEAAYERKMYRYKAQYSLDCENGIENTVLTKPQTPEMVLEEKQLQKQVYFRHSCTFCTPHFFYKPQLHFGACRGAVCGSCGMRQKRSPPAYHVGFT